MPLDFNEGGYAWESVETVLRRRGHVVARRGDPAKVLFTARQFVQARAVYEKEHGFKDAESVIGRNVFQQYVQMYGRTALRKMLRHLVAAPDRTMNRSELEGIAGKRCGPLLQYMGAVGMVSVDNDVVRLSTSVSDLAPSLEQYVQMVCMSELRGHAEWGLSLKDVGSGDFDVLAWLPPTLVYFECKTGSPNNIEATSLREMLRRTLDLAPDLTILVLDSEGDISPVTRRLRMSGTVDFGVDLDMQSHAGKIYFGVFQHWPIYVINDDPNLLTQIRRCLRHYHSFGKWGQQQASRALSL